MDIEKAIEWQEKFKKAYKSMSQEADEACDFTIKALEELNHLKKLYEKVDLEKIVKFSQTENIDTSMVNVSFSYNKHLSRDEAIYLLAENLINILNKEAE